MTTPLPVKFEPQFARPEDAQSSWAYDPMHFARPLPRLSQEFYRTANAEAFGLESIFVNGYLFTKDFAPPPPTPEVIEKGVVKIWTEEFVPRIEEFCASVRSRNYDAMSATELAEAIPGIMVEAGQAFEYTMIVVFPFMGPTLGLVEFAEQALGPDGPMLIASMLQSHANETASAGEGMNDLVELALRLPAVAAALREERFDDLPNVSGGAEFVAALDGYLEKYGWRADDWGTVHKPTWAEDRRIPLRLLAVYLRDPNRAPGASLRRSAELRAAAEAEFASRLDEQTRGQLQAMLDVARPHVMMSEGRARWQLTIVGSTRVPILALGRKLQAAGALDHPNDAFYLHSHELREVAAQPTSATKRLVEERKAELAAQEAMTPPPFVGAPMDLSAAPPEAQAVFRRFFGVGTPPSDDPAVVTGIAASPGVARGRARVILELDDSDGFEPGDILVCKLTAPPWTPLFAIASAVVTDTGGILSHSAICAREFAIPCVTGTNIGTAVIRDGAMVTVDGGLGVVRIGD